MFTTEHQEQQVHKQNKTVQTMTCKVLTPYKFNN